MLVEFRVTNYRSIRDTQVFSMVASKDTSLQDSNCIKTGIDAIPTLVRSAVLYGANASGKSNLIAALASMVNIISDSATHKEGESWKKYIMPFSGEEEPHKPTKFEIIFIEDSMRYEYGFSLTTHRVIEEWLIVYKTQKPQIWLDRKYNAKTDEDEWNLGPNLKGEKKLWADSTRANALFLSTAVQLNSEQLRPIYRFLTKIIVFKKPPNVDHTLKYILENNGKDQVLNFMKSADLGITDIQVEQNSENEEDIWREPSLIKEGVKYYFNSKKPKTTFFHKGINASPFSIDLSDESQGTQRLLAYALPFMDALENGRMLIVDELDSSLHPQMVRFLLSLVNNPKLNKNNAQLFFSTHNTSLLDTEILRRDQIWFVEKDSEEQASHLYPLTDFSPRKGEALEKGYLMGRYGAIPFFGEINL